MKKFRNYLTLSSAFGFVMAPIALAASCGGSEAPAPAPIPPKVTTIDVSSFVNNIKYVSGQSNAVKWSSGFNANETAQLPEGVSSIDFLVGNYPTQAAALAARSTLVNKVFKLPSTVERDYDKRFVWAFITLQDNYKLINDVAVFDLTKTSQVQSIVSYMSRETLDGSFLAKSASFAIRGTLATPLISWADQVLPTGLKIEGYNVRIKFFSGEVQERPMVATIKEVLDQATNLTLFKTSKQLNEAPESELLISVILGSGNPVRFFLDAPGNQLKLPLVINLA